MTSICSEDRTIEASISPLGVVVRILSHEWHWIISARDGALHLQGSVHPVPEGHDPAARRPEDCAGCRELLQFVIPSGGRQAASPRLARLGRAVEESLPVARRTA